MTTPSALLVTPLPFMPIKSTPITGSTPLDLPSAAQHDWITRQVGGWADAATYHLQAVIDVHGNGIALGLQPNPVLWTLASAWRDRMLPYTLHGPAVITGPEDSDGRYTNLTPQLAAQTQQALQTATDWWLEHDCDIPLWPTNPSSRRFAEAVARTR
ncbi:hypothetical protein AB0G86_44965, partial [Streptomyces scabiei]|uniref:DUF3846 domain-containing protein n=1 Tax=Streptomyces scabiei TaxID=1930 RepID=UPI0033F40EF8